MPIAHTGHLQTSSQDVLIWGANVIKAGVLTRGDNRAVAYPDTLSRSYSTGVWADSIQKIRDVGALMHVMHQTDHYSPATL